MILVSRQSLSMWCCSVRFQRNSHLDFRKAMSGTWSSFSKDLLHSLKYQSITWAKKKIYNISSLLQEVSGFKELRIAQEQVSEASSKFSAFQEQRREAFVRIKQVQGQLKQIHAELDKTKRGEDKFVNLLVEESKLLKMEQMLQDAFDEVELKEKEQFTALLLALNNSREKERLQMKTTQYWSIIASLCGALLGIIGTMINNQMRYNKLRELITSSITDGWESIYKNREQRRNCKNLKKENHKNGSYQDIMSSKKSQMPNLLNLKNEMLDSQQKELTSLEIFIAGMLAIIVIKAVISVCSG